MKGYIIRDDELNRSDSLDNVASFCKEQERTSFSL